MSLSRRGFLAAVGALPLVLAACSGIPGSGPVQDVTKPEVAPNIALPQPPAAGALPDQIVLGFIGAVGSTSPDTAGGPAIAAAQQYLSPNAQKTWQAKPTQIIIGEFRATIDPDTVGAVRIIGNISGMRDVSQVYSPVRATSDAATYTYDVQLVRVEGEWRIDNPPAELLMPQSGFAANYDPRLLYFLDPSGTVVVPDRRYIVSGGTDDNRVTRLIQLLAGGPVGVLSGVAKSFVDGAALRGNVGRDATLTTPDGVTHVDLTLATPVGAAADRRALAAQIVWTLSEDLNQVVITIDGQPLEADNTSNQPYTVKLLSAFDPDRTPGAGQVPSDAFYVDPDGRLVDLVDGRAMWGDVGDGTLEVHSAAMSAATGTLAAVCRGSDGTTQALYLGQPLDREQPAQVLEAQALSKPSFTRSGEEVWVVQNGRTETPEVFQIISPVPSAGTGSSSQPGGSATRSKVDTGVLAGKGEITSLALSPDGVRVAIVAGGNLYLAAVTTADQDEVPGSALSPGGGATKTGAAIANLTSMRPDLRDVQVVAFRSSTELLVAAKTSGGASVFQSVNRISVDGADRTPVTGDGLQGEVDAIAISDTGMYISFSDRVWMLSGSLDGGRWVTPPMKTTPQTSVLEGTEPFFPN